MITQQTYIANMKGRWKMEKNVFFEDYFFLGTWILIFPQAIICWSYFFYSCHFTF